MASFAIQVMLVMVATSAYVVEGQKNEPCLVSGGNITDVLRFPFITSIHYQDLDRFVPFCCGTVLNSRWILTAGQCLLQSNGFTILKNKAKMLVSMGLTIMSSYLDLKSLENVYKPEHMVVHPMISKWFPQYDIGLIRLNRRITMGSRVSRVPMLTQSFRRDVNPLTVTRCTIVSWGISEQSGKRNFQYGDQPLKFFSIQMVAETECEFGLPVGGEKFIVCTRCKTKSSSSPCMGDIGAPLMCDGFQVGVVSWCSNCNKADTPVVHTRISALQGWVDNEMRRFNGAQKQQTSFVWILVVIANVVLYCC